MSAGSPSAVRAVPGRRTAFHGISGRQFDALATGGGCVRDIECLVRAQLSRRLLVLWDLAARVGAHWPDSREAVCLRAALDTILSARANPVRANPVRANPERANPVRASAVRASAAGGSAAGGSAAWGSRQRPVDEVLANPSVGVWLVRCWRAMDQVDLAGPLDPVLGRELGHAGAVAAAAALRAGIPFDLPVHIRDGAVTLPGLGVLRLGGRDGWARVSSAGEGGFVLWPPGQGLPVGATATTQGATTQGATRQGAAGPGEQGHWIPLRVLEAGNGRHRFRLTVDDLDPNRDCQVLAVAARLDRRTVQRWSALLVRGWPLVVAHDPAQAAAMGAGLSTLVPLDDRGRSRYASATCSDALGAVAATTPHDPTDLAVTLVHEFAHFKLGALLDLVELHDGSADAVHYAPWRADPRPVGGLLQGAYAFLAVAGFWRSRALASTGAPAAQAAFEFAWCREAVRRALAGLRSSGRLTRLGERFTAGMTARLDQWAGVPVPPAVRRWAIVMNDDVQIIWRLRHRRPDPAQVAAWASAWQRGAPWDPGVIPATPAASGASARVHAGPRAVPRCAIPTTEARTSRHPRQALVRAHLADPRLVGSGRLPVPEGLPGLTPGALTRADVLLIAGNHEAAAQGYAARLAAGMPGVPDLAAFAGLAVARRLASATGPGFRPGPETAAFVEHPEVLYGLTRWFRDRTGRLPDVDALAAWVGGDPRARRGYRDGRLAEHPAGTGGRLH